MSDKSPEMTISMEAKQPDWNALEKAFEESIDKGLDALRDRIEDTWNAKASTTLKTSLKEYQKNLKVTRSTDGVTVTIEGWLPVAVELGVPRFDMKPGLLAGRLSRVIKLDGPKGKGFRTVAPRQSDLWWHPGIQARSIYEQVKTEMDSLVGDSFVTLLSRVMI